MLVHKYYVSYSTSDIVHDGTLREVIIYVDYKSSSGCDTTYYWAPLSDTIMLWISDSLIGKTSDTVQVPINISEITTAEIYGISLTLSYNNNVLIAKQGYIRGIIPSVWSIQQNILIPGQIILAMAGSSTLDTSGCLIKVIFDIIGNQGDTTALHFKTAKLNEGDPPIKTRDGFFKVKDVLISGYIGYYPNLDFSIIANFDSLFKRKEDFDSLFVDSTKIYVDSVKVKLTYIKEDSTFTDSRGFYIFHDLPDSIFMITPYKNDKINNSINAYDAALILKYTAKLIQLSPYQLIAADVTEDSSVSTYDASYILRKSVGLITEFPIEADWTFVPHDFVITSTNWSSAPRYRSYERIKEYKTNQNFYSIVYGDVSGNWRPSKELVAKGETDDLLISHLVVDDLIQLYENKANLTVGIEEVSDVHSFSLSLKYDPKRLKIISVSNTRQTNGYSLVYNIEDMYLNIAAAGTKAITGNGSLINIEFELSKSATNSADNSFLITSFSLNEIQVTNLNKVIGLNIVSALPTKYAVSQNYPNPFNLQTMIKYQLPEKAHVKIDVFNLLGQRVRTLVNEEIKAGYHQVNWDGQDDFQNIVASGVYICRFQANQIVSNRKMVVLK